MYSDVAYHTNKTAYQQLIATLCGGSRSSLRHQQHKRKHMHNHRHNNKRHKKHEKYEKHEKHEKSDVREYTIKQPWFKYIKSGQKKIEGRLFKGSFKHIKSMDTIIWNHKEMKIRVKVTSVRHYNTFKELLEEEGIDKVLPNTTSVMDGVNIYRTYFSEADEKKYGVVAIEMEKINDTDEFAKSSEKKKNIDNVKNVENNDNKTKSKLNRSMSGPRSRTKS